MTTKIQTTQSSMLCQALLSSVFATFDREDVKYCLLRNYSSLPEHVDSDKDIDILVDNLSKAELALRQVATKEGWMLHLREDFGNMAYFFHKWTPEGGLAFIHIDLYPGMHWKHVEFIPNRVAFQDRVAYKGFYIPPPGVEGAILLLERLLWKGRVKENYKSRIPCLVKKDRQRFLHVLKGAFGQRWALQVCQEIEVANWTAIESWHQRLRMQLVTRSFLKSPARQLRAWGHYLGRIIRRLLRPSGFFIAVVGPDGSGKSTVIAKLIEELRPTFPPGKNLLLHWRPGVLPIHSSRCDSQALIESCPVENPHEASPRGLIPSLLHFLYCTVDFILGYVVKIYPLKARAGLIVIDRYYYDFLVDPLRYRMRLPAWMPRLFAKFVPKPDLVIYLHNTPQELHKRKQELPLEELAKQTALFKALLPSLPNAHQIDTNCSLDKVVRKVVSLVLREMVNRLEKPRR